MSETHRRASDVAANLGVDLDPSFVRSMVMSALCRDEFGDAMTAARRLLTHARAIADPGLAIEARYLLGISAFWAADLELARHHFTAVVDAFDPASRSTHHGRFGHDPAVVCLSRLANTLFFLGEDDLARATCERALTLATDVDNPMSHDTALVFANVLAVDLADHELLRRTADGLSGVRTDGVPFATKLEAVLGLIDVLDGDHTTGIQRGIAALDGCHGRNYFPGFQATLGRIVIAAHEAAEDAIGGLETATRILSLHSTPLWDPELHRLRAVWLAETGAPPAEVRTALESGAGIARDRGALGQLRRIEASMARFETSTSSARPRAV